MSSSDFGHALAFVLVTDDPVVEAVVRACCPAPHRVQVFAKQGLVGPQNTLSAHGMAIAEAASEADAVLVEWDFAEAPALNTLCFPIRRQLRAPVLMLCREGPEAMAACVAAGADDAVTFPLYPHYLQAKIFSHRRLIQAAREAGGTAPSSAPAVPPSERRYGSLRLDLAAHRFYIENTEVELTPREFALLEFLIERAGTLCTRDQILDAVWGITFDTGTNMVDVYMYFLRKKLEAYGLKGMIQTVRGHGYRLEKLEDAA